MMAGCDRIWQAARMAILLDPLLGAEGAESMLRVRDAFGPYGMYSNEGHDTGYAPELPQRIDAIRNHLRHGNGEPVGTVAARTNYFRETYAYGDEITAPGIEPFLHHEGLAAAARSIHGRELVVPAIVFANLYLPGQELAIHTDVPEFRGANRTVTPQWLVVAMHHSGLFDRWRMPIATGVSFFGPGESGALVTYPEGPDGPRVEVAPRHDTALVLDTDTVFHGVDRVAGDDTAIRSARPGMRLHPGARWQLRDGDAVVAEIDPASIRFSVSWKGYCFVDDADRRRWAEHGDDLTLDRILDTIEADLRSREVLRTDRPAPAEFGLAIVDTYTRFPG